MPIKAPLIGLPKRSGTVQTLGSIEQVMHAALPEEKPLLQLAIQQRQQSLDLAVQPGVLEKAIAEQLVDTPRSSIEGNSTRRGSIQSELRKYMSPIELFCDGWCKPDFREDDSARVVRGCASLTRAFTNAQTDLLVVLCRWSENMGGRKWIFNDGCFDQTLEYVLYPKHMDFSHL